MVHDRIVQGLISFFLAHLDHTGNLMGLTFTNEIRNRYIDDQNFKGGNPSRDVDPLEEILRDYSFERFGKCGPDLVLLIGRENVDDSVDRF